MCFKLLSRILRAAKHDMKHHDKIKLPSGHILVPMKDYGTFYVGDMVYKPYYVSRCNLEGGPSGLRRFL